VLGIVILVSIFWLNAAIQIDIKLFGKVTCVNSFEENAFCQILVI